jgi:hypothetical protein
VTAVPRGQRSFAAAEVRRLPEAASAQTLAPPVPVVLVGTRPGGEEGMQDPLPGESERLERARKLYLSQYAGKEAGGERSLGRPGTGVRCRPGPATRSARVPRSVPARPGPHQQAVSVPHLGVRPGYRQAQDSDARSAKTALLEPDRRTGPAARTA